MTSLLGVSSQGVHRAERFSTTTVRSSHSQVLDVDVLLEEGFGGERLRAEGTHETPLSVDQCCLERRPVDLLSTKYTK